MGKESQYRRRFWIGIDIGKEGAIVIQENDKPITSYAMPVLATELDYNRIYEILEPYEGGNGMVVFEKIVPYVGNKTSIFSMGMQAGAIEMTCVALAIPYTKIPPQTWQKEMFTGVSNMTKKSTTTKSGESRDTKTMALIAAQRLFPGHLFNFPNQKKTTKPHNGLVDALLMSEFAKRKFP